MTLRDQVWDTTLVLLADSETFKLSDLGFDESERHTVRRVLQRMEELDWLSRETKNSSIWHKGPKYREYFTSSGDE